MHELLAGVLDGDGLLRDEDHVGATGDPAHDRDPTRVPSHDLDDHHAVVGLGGRVEPVDRLGRDRDGGVEAERVVRPGEIVVDRLRDADDRQRVLAMEACGNPERVLASDRDERIELRLAEVAQHGLDSPVYLVRIGSRRAEDRAAAREYSRDLAPSERSEDPLGQSLPPVADRDHLVTAVGRSPDDGPDHGVQPRAVAAAGQDPDSHDGVVLDLGRLRRDERREIAGRHEHGVDTGSLELGDVLRRRVVELRDRELPGRDVVQQLEQHGQRIVVGVLARRQEEHLRIEVVERALEVLRLGDPNHALEPESVSLVPHGEVGLDDHGVGSRAARVEHAAEVQQRKLRGDPHRVHPADRGEPVADLLPQFGISRQNQLKS